MAAQTRWDPFKELVSVQKRMNQLFESALVRTDYEAPEGVDTWTPICDVYEAPHALVLCLELPGFEQDQIDLRLEGDDLIVSGEREIDREQPGEHFHRVERPYGKFARRFRLPSTVDREAVQASYRDGLLRIALPNRKDRRSQPIRVAID
jgi:HSP20 family protein